LWDDNPEPLVGDVGDQLDVRLALHFGRVMCFLKPVAEWIFRSSGVVLLALSSATCASENKLTSDATTGGNTYQGMAGGTGALGGGGLSSGGTAPGNVSAGGSAGALFPLGASRYEQTFNSLQTGALWKKNLDGSKISAYPENAWVTATCGVLDSACLRIVYRQPDGIHKHPAPSPVFTTTNGEFAWTPSDAGHTGTATDVIQANIAIDGTTDGTGKASNPPLPSKAYTLSYDLYFEPGFDFAKGGKLPGLAAKSFDSGCTEEGSPKRNGKNWSVRVMWRNNGRLQLYSYDQTRPSGSCGVTEMIDALSGDAPYEMPGVVPNDDKFRFQPGTWYTLRISVRVNDNDRVAYQLAGNGTPLLNASGSPIPTGGNGEISLAVKSIDGSVKRLLVAPNVALRDECLGPCGASVPDSPDAWANAVFFSTFYGGNEVKRTTCLGSLPTYPGLTQPIFDSLCASQRLDFVFPSLTWEPQTPSAARFDNITVVEGYTAAPF